MGLVPLRSVRAGAGSPRVADPRGFGGPHGGGNRHSSQGLRCGGLAIAWRDGWRAYRRDFGRYREHDMEVWHRQQIGLTIRKPSFARGALAFGTLPGAAGVIRDPAVRAVLARLDVTAEGRGPAELDRRHDAALHAADMAVVGTTISRTMAAEYIRHLQFGAHCPGSGGRYHLQLQSIERALGRRDCCGRHMGIASRGREVAVPQKDLDDPDINPALQQVRGKGSPERLPWQAVEGL